MRSEDSLAEHPVIADLKDFDMQSGNVIERVLFNHRLAVIAVSVIVTVILAYQTLGLNVNAAFDKMIPTDHPFIANYHDNKSQLSGIGNTVRIVVETKKGDIFNPEYLKVVQEINDEIFLYPEVDRPYMKSIWASAVRWTGVTEEGLDGGPVIPEDYDGSAESLNQLRLNVERSGEVGGLIANDYKSSVILLPLQDKISETGERINYHALSKKLEDIRTKYNSDNINIRIIGFAKVVGDLIDGLSKVMMFFGIAIVICTAILHWYTRCWRSVALVVTCSVIADVWLLGALAALGLEIDPYTVLVPFLIFAIGMSHGAQKMNGIMQDIGRGTHRLIAARYTFRRLFLAGMTALLADAVGFAVLMVIQIRVIQELAITASIGVAFLIFTNLILLPILLSYFGVSAKAAQRSLKSESVDALESSQTSSKKRNIWTFFNLFTQRKYATFVVVGAAVLSLFGIVVSTHLKIGDTGEGAPELRVNSRYNVDNAYIVKHYSASSDTYIVMVKTPEYHCAHYQTLQSVDELQFKLQQLPGVEATNSLASLAKQSSAGLNEGSLKWFEIPRSQDMLNIIITRAPREMFNQACNLMTIYVSLKDHKADTLDSVVNTVDTFAKKHNNNNIKFMSAAGNAGIEAATNIVVKHSNRLMLLLVYAAVIMLAFIAFRSWRAVVCAILPLMLTSILCEALMVYLNIGVKVATLPVIALGVGIGVDYALYIMTVTLTHLRKGEALSVAYHKALLFTGRVVVLTGVTLGIAVATWAFAPIKFQADMGILLSFMFVVNMIGALVLLPALASFLLKPKLIK